MSDIQGCGQNICISQAILKVASRCNLNCSYCYVYNMADSTWKLRPPLMTDEVFDTALKRIAEHCHETSQEDFRIAFHGGEPCLIGAEIFDTWCGRARAALDGVAHLQLVVQTNGTLLDARWIDVLLKHRVSVGISMDGPKEIHDRVRVDHREQGSYERVERGLKLLQEAHVPYGVGCVIPLGADPLVVHHHFLALGCTQITYLMPHYIHDTIGAIRERYGPTPCADFLLPIFDDWWFESTMDVQITDLKNVARVILGGRSHSEAIGNDPPGYVFIEPDGEMEGLDNLRACCDGLSRIKLNIRDAGFGAIAHTETMHSQAIFAGMPLAEMCRRCPEGETCAGGYLPHRYSSARGFDNPSVWCADLLKLFAHLRGRLGISVEETRERRQRLALQMAPARNTAEMQVF